MAKQKIDKRFQLSDSSVNVYGFRLLTDGYQLDEFQKNPIGYYMHLREEGVVVRWEDLTIEDDKVFGTPVINLSNGRGQQTVDEVENGFLNAASVGDIVVLEWSDDPALQLPGQTGPTVTRWYNRECSLVDVPGNMNALALYNQDGDPINLADLKSSKPARVSLPTPMSSRILSLLQLSADASATKVEDRIRSLMALASEVDQLQAENKKALQEIDQLKQEATQKKVQNLVDEAIRERKITAAQKEHYLQLAAANYEAVQSILGSMQPYQSIEGQLSNLASGKSAEIQELMQLTGKELFLQNKMDKLKSLSMPHFRIKYREYFEKEYNDKATV